jgi:hypothetical protein
MHLVIDVPEWPTLRQRLARAVSLDFCIALTRAQRLARAFFWACAGATIALIFSAIVHIASVPPVKLLEPEIRHVSEAYTAYRLRFAWQSIERICDLVVFHDRPITWSLTCEPL